MKFSGKPSPWSVCADIVLLESLRCFPPYGTQKELAMVAIMEKLRTHCPDLNASRDTVLKRMSGLYNCDKLDAEYEVTDEFDGDFSLPQKLRGIDKHFETLRTYKEQTSEALDDNVSDSPYVEVDYSTDDGEVSDSATTPVESVDHETGGDNRKKTRRTSSKEDVSAARTRSKDHDAGSDTEMQDVDDNASEAGESDGSIGSRSSRRSAGVESATSDDWKMKVRKFQEKIEAVKSTKGRKERYGNVQEAVYAAFASFPERSKIKLSDIYSFIDKNVKEDRVDKEYAKRYLVSTTGDFLSGGRAMVRSTLHNSPMYERCGEGKWKLNSLE